MCGSTFRGLHVVRRKGKFLFRPTFPCFRGLDISGNRYGKSYDNGMTAGNRRLRRPPRGRSDPSAGNPGIPNRLVGDGCRCCRRRHGNRSRQSLRDIRAPGRGLGRASAAFRDRGRRAVLEPEGQRRPLPRGGLAPPQGLPPASALRVLPQIRVRTGQLLEAVAGHTHAVVSAFGD